MKAVKTKDGYPTKEALMKIVYWDWLKEKNLKEYLDFIEQCWEYPDRFVLKKGYTTFPKRAKIYRLYLSTGGWSGNEDIIRALRDNFFWFIFWHQSKRGGHYYFEIPLNQISPRVVREESK